MCQPPYPPTPGIGIDQEVIRRLWLNAGLLIHPNHRRSPADTSGGDPIAGRLPANWYTINYLNTSFFTLLFIRLFSLIVKKVILSATDEKVIFNFINSISIINNIRLRKCILLFLSHVKKTPLTAELSLRQCRCDSVYQECRIHQELLVVNLIDGLIYPSTPKGIFPFKIYDAKTKYYSSSINFGTLLKIKYFHNQSNM